MRHRVNLSQHSILQAVGLALCYTLLLPSAAAVNYTAYPGSTVIITTTKGKITGSSANSSGTTSANTNLTRPFLGGLIAPGSSGSGYGCLYASQVKRVDGWTGVQLSSSNIIAGVTGTILNGVANYQLANATERTRITGGLSFDAFGAATAVGDISQDMAGNRLCAGVTVPAGTRYTTPGNSAWGNAFADLDLKTWLYVPVNTAPGTYSLNQAGIVQGSTSYAQTEFVGYYPIINPGDTVEVLEPPCTISTQTSIVFDTTTDEGMKVSAPVTFQCGQLQTASSLEAFLQVRPLGTTTSNTEMNLTINGSQPGGVVRGYAGSGLNTSNANCQDNSYSLSFAEAFAKSIGSIASGNTAETPLIWQLCRKGNEVAGLATGSAILSINYK